MAQHRPADGMQHDYGSEEPVLLGGNQPARPGPDMPAVTRGLGLVAAPPKALPRKWPPRDAEAVWGWLAQQRAPITVTAGGSEGGTGTTTVTALLGETIAAGSPSSTVLLDQSGDPWGSLSRRLLGQRTGLTGPQVLRSLNSGIPALQLLRAAPTTSAGAAVILDGADTVPLVELRRLVQSTSAAMLVDAGRIEPRFAGKLGNHPIVLVIGRTDVVGAEAVCAAVRWIQGFGPIQPVVVLSSTTPTDQGRVTATRKFVGTIVDAARIIHLPFDEHLAHSQDIRLDRLNKTTVRAVLHLVSAIREAQEGIRHAR